eukprot:TRINITY_DN3366_c0_g1_i2.p1 TRINITY_DN3366_c0_g1~~TRINITY_DN3366_c0_g1_i2.p1  ORF type:complete len:318 (+),score=53.58 TRINITY_DN3366_c0_g1_i2:132-956(+)
MRYVVWKNTKKDCNRKIVFVHGLTRNSRDFDAIATYMTAHHGYTCFSIDIVGRGKSERLPDPADYGYPQYMSDMSCFFAAELKPDEKVDWVGSSMGGLLGMMLGSKAKNPIGRFVINDVGTKLQKEDLERIGSYVGQDKKWDTFDEAFEYTKTIYNAFGLTNEECLYLAKFIIGKNGEKYSLTYDPNIRVPFEEVAKSGGFKDVDLGVLWNNLQVDEIMLVRGELSQLLAKETFESMKSHPKVKVAKEFEGIGHCPMFFEEKQIKSVAEFLTPI